MTDYTLLSGMTANKQQGDTYMNEKLIATEEEKKFLRIVNNPKLRARLLDRLAELGLLSAFLQAENETMQ